MNLLETKRLFLRSFTMEDAQDVFEYSKDVQTTAFLTWEPHTHVLETQRVLREVLMKPNLFAICLKNEQKCIGCIDLRIDETHKKIEFGYVLNKNYWNAGYMTEVLKTIITYCFEDLKANRVEAKYNVLNEASGNVMKKCGMKQEGIGRQEEFYKGRYEDLVHMAILAEDYFKQQ